MTGLTALIWRVISSISIFTSSEYLSIHPLDIITLLFIVVSIILVIENRLYMEGSELLIILSIILIYTSIVSLHIHAELLDGWSEMIYRLYNISIPIIPALLSTLYIFMWGVFRRRETAIYLSYMGVLITILVSLSLTTPIKHHLLSNPYIGYQALPSYLIFIHAAILISSILIPMTSISRVYGSLEFKERFLIAKISVSIPLFLGLYTFYSAVAIFHLMILASAVGLLISIKLGLEYRIVRHNEKYS